jgi:hypothetical protein
MPATVTASCRHQGLARRRTKAKTIGFVINVGIFILPMIRSWLLV